MAVPVFLRAVRRLRRLIWAAVALLTALVLVAGYVRGRWTWEGTGFSGASLWDWLDLLFVPLILGIGGFWLQRTQRQRELEDQQRQTQRERDADSRRRQRELQMEDRQRQRELETEEQRAQSVALQAYLEQMARLLLEEGLHEAREGPISAIIANLTRANANATVARAYTLTTLERMDSIRKRSIVRFLFEARLCTRVEGSIVSLKEADLTQADLKGMYLPGIDLTSTDLRKADLSDTRLVSLVERDVPGTTPGNVRVPRPGEDYFLHLRLEDYSILDRTDLRGANLRNARLSYCSFHVTKLRHADLRGADLRAALGLDQKQVEEAIGDDQETLLPDYCQTPEAWSLSYDEQLRRLEETSGE